MSRVDLAVPCYRYGHFLRRCVQSVLSQPNVEVRVLILDDASPDSTPAVAAALVAEDARVSYRRHASNLGHIATFNEGLDWAQGDYVLLLSADDELTPGALARAVQVMEEHADISVTFGDTIVTDDPSVQKYDPPTQFRCQLLDSALWIEGFCNSGTNIAGHGTATALVRTSMQKKCGYYRAELPHTGDMEMWLRLGLLGRVGIVKAKQAYYRQHGSAMHHLYEGIRDIRQRKLAFDFFFEEHRHRLPNGEQLQQMANRRLAAEAVRNARLAFEKAEPEAGRDWLRFARATDEPTFAESAQVGTGLAEACVDLSGKG